MSEPHTPRTRDAGEYVKLFHCPKHNLFQLGIGRASFCLTPRELLLLGGAIERWWLRHPDQFHQIQPFNFDPSDSHDEPGEPSC